jgi:Rrf2 family protein
MIDLAVYSTDEHVSLSSIAKRQEISEKYLEQVFSVLRKSGLVKSVKGAEGGYVLGRSAESIKVSSILMALEGNLSLIDPEPGDNMEDAISRCIRENVWDRMNGCLNELLEGVTLQELKEELIEHLGKHEPMYYI